MLEFYETITTTTHDHKDTSIIVYCGFNPLHNVMLDGNLHEKGFTNCLKSILYLCVYVPRFTIYFETY